MGFKLIINNQGQFITELSKYPLDKVHLHFKKENAGVIKALLKECNAKFDMLTEDLEKIASDVFHTQDSIMSLGTQLNLTYNFASFICCLVKSLPNKIS